LREGINGAVPEVESRDVTALSIPAKCGARNPELVSIKRNNSYMAMVEEQIQLLPSSKVAMTFQNNSCFENRCSRNQSRWVVLDEFGKFFLFRLVQEDR
jgi:hypothetical protein